MERTSYEGAGWERYLPISGVLFSLVLVAALVGLFAGGAEPDDAFKSISKTLTGERGGLLVRYQFQLAASGLFIVYLGCLLRRLESAEAQPSPLIRIAFGAGLIGITLITLTNAVNAALAASVAGVAGDGPVWALFQAGQAAFTFASMFLGLFLLAGSEVIRRTRALPRWQAYLGLVAGAAYVIGSFSVADQRGPLALPGLLGFVLFIVWTVATSVTMVLRGRAPAQR